MVIQIGVFAALEQIDGLAIGKIQLGWVFETQERKKEIWYL